MYIAVEANELLIHIKCMPLFSALADFSGKQRFTVKSKHNNGDTVHN